MIVILYYFNLIYYFKKNSVKKNSIYAHAHMRILVTGCLHT